MIKCKEDLYNTYIVNDFGKLRDKYKEVCKKFGIKPFSCKTCDHGAHNFLMCDNQYGNFMIFGSVSIPKFKQLTLVDFKEDKSMFDLRGTKIDLRKPDGSVDEEKISCISGNVFCTRDLLV